MSLLKCTECKNVIESFSPKYRCLVCGGLLEYALDYERPMDVSFTGELTFWRYRKLLPEVKNLTTMHEGGTPLHKARRLARHVDLENLHLKDETRNPTNSYRDRSSALLVSNALDLNLRALICATSGNVGASLSAYCAKYGILCHVVIPTIVDMGKLAQMLIYDAVIEEYGETVDKSIERAGRLAEETGWYQATPELNPLVLEAQKTMAFEVVEQLGVPDWFVVSMGSGGTLYSVWKGFQELFELGKIEKLPRMVGVQAEGCSPIVDSYLEAKRRKLRRSFTRAIGIFVREPVQEKLALRAIEQSHGVATAVSDYEIISAEEEIAKFEGIFAEPASSIAIAALKKLRSQSVIDREDVAVCLITGSGLKATDVLQALSKKRKTAVVGTDFSTKEKILRILNQRDTYGYELWKLLGKTMTRSAVYQHLNDLSSRGLVSSSLKEEKKYFVITGRGRRVLQAIDEMKAIL